MPEFLTEANYHRDFQENPLWVVGESKEEDDADDFRAKVSTLISCAHQGGSIQSDAMEFMSTKEAEALKYFRNCFLAVKVSFCNEFRSLCVAKGVDYERLRSVACQDGRIGLSHTRVPGPDGALGFGGTCFPKDVASLICQFSGSGVDCPLLLGAQTRNDTIDRPQQDWRNDKGRAVVDN
jgi:UDP-glucose 6-dehydrogenase